MFLLKDYGTSEKIYMLELQLKLFWQAVGIRKKWSHEDLLTPQIPGY